MGSGAIGIVSAVEIIIVLVLVVRPFPTVKLAVQPIFILANGFMCHFLTINIIILIPDIQD
jgi:high-affinity Fe2+/Pb2+ permease